MQYDKPVVLAEETTILVRRNQQICLRRITSYETEIHVSERVKIKPKMVHLVHKVFHEALDLLKARNPGPLPKLLILDSLEEWTKV